MSKIYLIKNYFTYLLRARNEHAVHSPFLFDFYTKAVKNNAFPEELRSIEALRSSLLNSEERIRICDFGAGSSVDASKVRKIKEVVKSAEKSLRLRKLLFRTVQYFQPSVLLDIGTSFGITTMAQAAAAPNSKVYTFEGCAETVRISKINFSKLKFNNIELTEGNFDDTLQARIAGLSTIDYAFFDGNHRLEPTLQYFDICLKKAHNDSVFVFDDIYWSEEMKEAWNRIKNHTSVTLSLDFFFLGMIFFKKELSKENFVLKL